MVKQYMYYIYGIYLFFTNIWMLFIILDTWLNHEILYLLFLLHVYTIHVYIINSNIFQNCIYCKY